MLPQRAHQQCAVEHLTPDEGRATWHGGIVAPREVVVNDDIVSVTQQFRSHDRADIARSARHQYAHRASPETSDEWLVVSAQSLITHHSSIPSSRLKPIASAMGAAVTPTGSGTAVSSGVVPGAHERSGSRTVSTWASPGFMRKSKRCSSETSGGRKVSVTPWRSGTPINSTTSLSRRRAMT